MQIANPQFTNPPEPLIFADSRMLLGLRLRFCSFRYAPRTCLTHQGRVSVIWFDTWLD